MDSKEMHLIFAIGLVLVNLWCMVLHFRIDYLIRTLERAFEPEKMKPT